MQDFIETAANVRACRGYVRRFRTTFGADGMAIVETGETDVMTAHAALEEGKKLIAAAAELLDAEQARVVKLRA